MEEEKVNVFISCQETVTYNQIVAMSKKDFDRLDKNLSSNERVVRREAEESVLDRINRLDPHDSHGEEVDTFELTKESLL